jgi:hypothetical protein
LGLADLEIEQELIGVALPAEDGAVRKKFRSECKRAGGKVAE